MDREQFVADPEESADRQHGVGNMPGARVEHDFLDLADVFALAAEHLVAVERARAHDVGAGATRLRR